MWVATQDLPRSAAHPFYTRLNQILDRADFDTYVEALCQRFYADEVGRPGLPPGRYTLEYWHEPLDDKAPALIKTATVELTGEGAAVGDAVLSWPR